MSASTVSTSNLAPFYTTDLEAKVACVLDRSAFLDSVTDAITHETKREDAHEMVAMMAANGFVPIIVALLTDRDPKIRQKAYLAFGNLIASENKKMSFLASTAGVKALDTISNAFQNAGERSAAAYVFANLAQFLASVMASETRSNMRNTLEKTLRSDANWSAHVGTIADLLRAAQDLEAWNQVPTQVVLNALDNRWKRCFNSALRILGEQISEDDFSESFRGPAFQTLRTLLLSDHVPANHAHEFFWTFSNLVVESGVGDLFLNDDVLVAKVCDIIESYVGRRHSHQAIEPAYVLINAIARCSSLQSLSDDLIDRVEMVLLDVMDRVKNKTFETAVNEALNAIGSEKIHRDEMVAEEEMAALLSEIDAERSDYEAKYIETESDDMEIDDYACNPCFNLPCEHPTPAPAPAPVYNETQHFNPPCALDLLRRNLNFAPTSAIVNNLILSVQAAGGAFTPLPENTVLTVADLSALEARGFAIVRGYIGINTALSAIVFNV
jgi:hypothetical protein